jgi:hypothetical protein
VLDWHDESPEIHDKIISYTSQAARTLERLGDQRYASHTLINQAASLTAAALYPGKQAYVEQSYSAIHRSIEMSREILDRRAVAFAIEEFARLSMHFGNPYDALRLYASAHTLRHSIGSEVTPEQKPSYEATIDMVREMVRPNDRKNVWDEGARLSMDEAIEYALRTKLGGMRSNVYALFEGGPRLS